MDPKKFELRESKKALASCLQELNEYFAGARRDFSMPLDLRGTPYEVKVWLMLREIPAGQTTTYGAFAAKLDLLRASFEVPGP